jgi:lipopolysaccharide export system permease protein
MLLILYRYIVKEQLIPFGVCLLGVTVILITGRLMQLAQYLFTSSMTAFDFIVLIALAMPKLILFALPMASLIGVLLAFIRMSTDNEIIAMRSAGIGFLQFVSPVVTVLLLGTALALYVSISLTPAANRSFRVRLARLGQAGASILMKEGAFIDTVPKMIFFFQKADSVNLRLEGVFIRDDRQADTSTTIVADSGSLLCQEDANRIVLDLHNGVITRVGRDLKASDLIGFKAYDLKIDFNELMGNASAVQKGKSEMNLGELLQSAGVRGAERPFRYLLEYHQRFALPLGCMCLGLMGAPLGALFRRGSRMAGVTSGLAVFLFYYVLLSAGKSMGENGAIPPWVATWAPDFIAFSFAVYLWVKTHRETPSAFLGLLQSLPLLVERFGEFRLSLKKSKRAKESDLPV